MARAAPTEGWPRTVEDFEAWHVRQPERWEFIDGRPRLMAPASMKHSILKRNVFRLLDTRLPPARVKALVDGPQILTDEISAVPDVVVTCAPLDLTTPAVAEPAIIVEVMSPSSEIDETGRKWFSYRKIPSSDTTRLSQDERVVQVHTRAGELWRERFVSAGALELEDPPVRLEIDAVYAGTDLAD